MTRGGLKFNKFIEIRTTMQGSYLFGIAEVVLILFFESKLTIGSSESNVEAFYIKTVARSRRSLKQPQRRLTFICETFGDTSSVYVLFIILNKADTNKYLSLIFPMNYLPQM